MVKQTYICANVPRYVYYHYYYYIMLASETIIIGGQKQWIWADRQWMMMSRVEIMLYTFPISTFDFKFILCTRLWYLPCCIFALLPPQFPFAQYIFYKITESQFYYYILSLDDPSFCTSSYACSCHVLPVSCRITKLKLVVLSFMLFW